MVLERTGILVNDSACKFDLPLAWILSRKYNFNDQQSWNCCNLCYDS